MEYIGACGAVLYHKTNGVYKYLIIKNKDNQYEFPKGEPDDSNDYYNSTNKMIKEKHIKEEISSQLYTLLNHYLKKKG